MIFSRLYINLNLICLGILGFCWRARKKKLSTKYTYKGDIRCPPPPIRGGGGRPYSPLKCTSFVRYTEYVE